MRLKVSTTTPPIGSLSIAALFLTGLLAGCGKEESTDNSPVDTQSATVDAPAPEAVKTQSKIASGILTPYKTEQVAPHTYVIHGPRELPNKANSGFMNNPGFVITEKSVIVFDPGSSVHVGRELVARIKDISDKPLTHVFNTHVHGDHWLANHGIKEAFPDAQFYAHPKMIELSNEGEGEAWVKLMAELTENVTLGTESVVPENALQDLQEIKVDDITIKAHVGEKAHTITDVMFEVVEDKVLFTGDNITYKRIPRMTDGNFVGNIAAADYALKLPVEVVVPGHGPTGGKEVLSAYHKYLATVYEMSKSLAEEGLEDFEMKEKITQQLVEFKDWPGIDEQLGKHISQSVIEAEAADF